MKKESLTSLISAFGRAYHSQFDTPKIFDDYLAKNLLTQKEFNDIKENMVRGIQFFDQEMAEKFKGNADEGLKWITQIQLSPTPLARAAYCEKVLLNEILLGVKQYVILGAGLDTFGFRHPELENTLEIFEIDHPATQEFKKKRLEDANFTIPNNYHFVDMDFTKNFNETNLIGAGFRREKTFLSLLGVSYYLTKAQFSSLLNHLFSQLPSGSSIVFDYADENLFHAKGKFNRVENMVKMAAASGETMKSCFSYNEITSLLEKSGLLIYEHLSPEDIDRLYFRDRNDYLSAFETIHYLHAVKK
ncbi:methyltransferase (TIGR00027 family) [Bacillus oleivorans]|uniref:S-adenosyl-L-methionine-dependent methyltransferase n=1 Tax=Bacillus oleivorans TaxID=1448271 RepID=A0A285D6Z5_9BACI|nr:class I SAM-dependent methyltransferase [Bacillus oleivorans]SNX75591.1 methyltransferase (TIGR00027 family) [Bacillus oleivorans]